MRQASTFVEGLYFGEGPRWRPDADGPGAGRFFYSDFFAHEVRSVSIDGTDVRTEAVVPNQPSGLGWLPDGRLLIVSMIDRRVLRRESDGTLALHADLGAIATFHCNDMLVDPAGRAYVGNFGFDLDHFLATEGVEAAMAEPGPPKAKLALVAPDGTVSVAAEDLGFPNGTVLTPDGRTLIIGETMGMRLTAFDVDPATGALGNRRVWAPLIGEWGMCPPDGIALDAEGCVWVSNPLGTELVRVAEGGAVLDRVQTSQPSFACALGGPERRHLVICTAPTATAHEAEAAHGGRLEIVEVDVPGAGTP
jgi:sugar lactone lactonase YvrE